MLITSAFSCILIVSEVKYKLYLKLYKSQLSLWLWGIAPTSCWKTPQTFLKLNIQIFFLLLFAFLYLNTRQPRFTPDHNPISLNCSATTSQTFPKIVTSLPEWLQDSDFKSVTNGPLELVAHREINKLQLLRLELCICCMLLEGFGIS